MVRLAKALPVAALVGVAVLPCYSTNVEREIVERADGRESDHPRVLQQGTPPPATIASIFDTSTHDWVSQLFEFTVKLINNHTDGFHDDLFEDGTELEWLSANSACAAKAAVDGYWDLRTNQLGGSPPLGIIGPRCSSAAIALARIAGLEEVPIVSPASTSTQLSDALEFPYFSRTVAPGDSRGNSGALIKMLKHFGWSRVSIITTDTPFGKDLSTRFVDEWDGEVKYTGTILVNSDDSINVDSIDQVLSAAPTDDPTINSRIILLFAHEKHAYPILKEAHLKNFQPDTVWVGTGAWVNRPPVDFDSNSFLQGYLGITPYRNRDDVYQDYLRRFQEEQAANGQPVLDELPDYSAEYMVDAILALAKALDSIPPESRREGALVTEKLRSLSFRGVSGNVSFTEIGDRANPLYTIFNAQLDEATGNLKWVDVGRSGANTLEPVRLGGGGNEGICFAQVRCGQTEAPEDRYPVPKEPVPTWVLVVIPIIGVILLCVLWFSYKSWKKKREYKSRLQIIDDELLAVGDEVDAAKKRQQKLIAERMQLQTTPDTWDDSDDVLVEVAAEDEQYWDVADRLRETMSDAHISKLWRVQNLPLWTYYSFHKNRFSMHEIDENEKSVWHGTSSLDPSVIYNDKQDGFMMQFSNVGFWGRGIYFADKSKYSDSYAFKPAKGSSFSYGDERPSSSGDEREMFLAKLLVGNDILMDRSQSRAMAEQCKKLTVPPTDDSTGLKYTTVTGYTGGSQVWIVYENGRAFPDYLVRYYRGKRDPERTPYASREEARRNSIQESFPSETFIVGDGDEEMGLKEGYSSGDAVWEFEDNGGWTEYSSFHQQVLEDAYQACQNDPNHTATVGIHTDEWAYEVDVVGKVQTNLQHIKRRQRAVRRLTA